MLSIEVVHEINRLVRESELSQRQIAARLGVSRATVGEIASGRRGLHGRDKGDESAAEDCVHPVRCVRCGYRVYLPCRICMAREYRRQRLPRVEPRENRTKRRKRSCRAGSKAD